MELLNILFNLIQSSIIVLFIEKTMNKKKKNSLFLPFSFCLFLTAFITTINYFRIHEGMLGILFLIISYLYISYLSNDNPLKIAIISLLPFTMIGYISTLIVLLTSIQFNFNSQHAAIFIQNNFLLQLLATILFFIVSFSSINGIKRIDANLKKADSFYVLALLITILFMQIFLEDLIFTNHINQRYLFITYIFLIASLILIFILIHKMNANFKEVLKQQLDIAILHSNLQHNDEVLQLQNKIYQLRHDMKHLLQLQDSKKEEFIKSIVEPFTPEMEQLPFSYNTSNKVINYVLKIKKEQALANNINFTILTNIVEKIQLEDIDIYLLLMNLLDNAIENIGGDRRMRLTITSSNHTIIIKSYNSTNPTLPSMAQDLISTKKGEGHGIGLNTMKKIASKYRGSVVLGQKETTFIVDIEMKNFSLDNPQ